MVLEEPASAGFFIGAGKVMAARTWSPQPFFSLQIEFRCGTLGDFRAQFQ